MGTTVTLDEALLAKAEPFRGRLERNVLRKEALRTKVEHLRGACGHLRNRQLGLALP